MVNLSLQDPATTGEKLPNYIKKQLISIQLIRMCLSIAIKDSAYTCKNGLAKLVLFQGEKEGRQQVRLGRGETNGTKKLKYILGILI